MSDHNPAPWGDDLTPLIPAGDKRVLLKGVTSREALRVLAEDNFQFAKHRVNIHDEMLKALKEMESFALRYADETHEFNKPFFERCSTVIAKAEGK